MGTLMQDGRMKKYKYRLWVTPGQNQMVQVVVARDYDIGEQWEETLSEENSPQKKWEKKSMTDLSST